MFRALLLALSVTANVMAADPFEAAEENSLPLEIKTVEEKTESDIHYKSFFFTSQRENGVDFRIYAVYAAPAKPGQYPVLLHLHGGSQTADPQLVKRWAAYGYASLSFDWTGNMENKIAGTRPFSQLGAMTTRNNNDSMFPENIADSRVRYTQIAARRAIMALKSFPEADLARLGVMGLSWGGFNALLLGETCPTVSAVVDIYGGGFFTGAYQLTGPLIYRSESIRRAWLEKYDPSCRITQLKAPVMMLTGLNDIFVPLRQFQQTYSELPGDKHLILVPNINHSLTWNFIDKQAKSWLDHYLKGSAVTMPSFIAVEADSKTVKGRVDTHGQALQQVSVYYTWSQDALATDLHNKWLMIQAEVLKDNFYVALPSVAPAAGQQWLNYCIEAVTASGLKVSMPVKSIKVDAVAEPVAPAVMVVPGNFFADPSLEKQRGAGFNGKIFFNFSGKYDYDDSGANAHSGKVAVHLSGNNQLVMETSGIVPGTAYRLSCWLKGNSGNGGCGVQINWMKNGKYLASSQIVEKVRVNVYQQFILNATAPVGTTSAVLYFNAENSWIDDLSFSIVAAVPTAGASAH